MWLPIGLGMIGYHVAQSSSEFIIQSDATKQGLFYLVTLAPLAGSTLAIIPMLFDNFYGKKREQIFAELEARREAAEAEEKKIEEERRIHAHAEEISAVTADGAGVLSDGEAEVSEDKSEE